MLIEIIIAIALGILFGTLTGLMPGIHINLIAAILLSLTATLSKVAPLSLAVFIISLAITHTFLDFIPSIYLGAPDEDSFLSVLPGHEFLLEGEGHQAVLLTLYGSLIATLIIILISPFFILLLPSFYSLISFAIPFVLIFISLFMILREKEYLLSFIIFSLAGFLGYYSLNLPIKEPLLPLLTGLFGASTIIISLKNNSKPKKQKISSFNKLNLTKKETFRAFLASSISAPLCSFLPGIGSGHAALIGSEIIPQSKKGFLLMLGTINTIVMGLSFVTLFAIDRTRTGAAVAVKELIPLLDYEILLILLLTILVAGIISFFLGIYLSKSFANWITRIDYKKISYAVLLILLIINIIFTNYLGLLVLATATALGIFCILSNSRRTNLMGSIIIPVIIYYLTN
jgi:putative membrane protein